ncbi:hypothetical protein MJO28_001996 [Puccinia striiformis f. sp. tritici]|uniref:Uncharacterized protein n=1 Tax=Puccinia striiformis f. sp. tritici TaxID=168172 RepID=A0ACC0EVJ5_9BASI|nr:hypothetical protein MJO28_001996 [Puccinia striiformis f. sp. tritici]
MHTSKYEDANSKSWSACKLFCIILQSTKIDCDSIEFEPRGSLAILSLKSPHRRAFRILPFFVLCSVRHSALRPYKTHNTSSSGLRLLKTIIIAIAMLSFATRTLQFSALVLTLMVLSCTSRPLDVGVGGSETDLSVPKVMHRPEPKEYNQDLTDDMPQVFGNGIDPSRDEYYYSDAPLVDTPLTDTDVNPPRSTNLEVGENRVPVKDHRELLSSKSQTEHTEPS